MRLRFDAFVLRIMGPNFRRGLLTPFFGSVARARASDLLSIRAHSTRGDSDDQTPRVPHEC